MFSATRLAWVAAPLAAVIGLAAPDAAMAQKKKDSAKEPAREAAPAPAPAPAAAPAQQAQGGAGAGPMVVQVKAEPSQTEWTKVCGKDPSNNAEICYTTRDFVSEQGQPVLAAAVYDIKGKDTPKVVRFLMPLGLMLKPGIRFAVDQGPPAAGIYTVCFPNGCFAETAGLKDENIAALKKGTNINVSVQNQMGREVTFQVPLAGFAKAFDGAPIDPKVLEDQQKRLQEELEKRSEELRRRLEQSQATPGAPTAAAKQ